MPRHCRHLQGKQAGLGARDTPPAALWYRSVRCKPSCFLLPLLQVVNEGADPIQIVSETMSRPLIPEVNPLVAEAAHHAEVPSVDACGTK